MSIPIAGRPARYGSDPAGRFTGVDRSSRGTTKRTGGGLRWVQPWFGAGSRVRQRVEFDVADYDLTFKSAFGTSDGNTHRTHARVQTDVAASAAFGFSGGFEWLDERGGSTFITAGSAGAIPVERGVLGCSARAGGTPAIAPPSPPEFAASASRATPCRGIRWRSRPGRIFRKRRSPRSTRKSQPRFSCAARTSLSRRSVFA